MDNDNEDQSRRSAPEKTPSAPGGNFLWYAVPVGILLVLMTGIWASKPGTVDLNYGDLHRLIAQGAPQENPGAAIDVVEEVEGAQQTVRYSNLRDVRIGRYEITGRLTRQIIAPEERRTEPQENVAIRTPRVGLEEDGNRLFQLLDEKGFNNAEGSVAAEAAPSGWGAHLPLLAITAVLIILFIVMMRRLGGAGGAMAFGRSRGRLVAPEDVSVTFDDVAGIDEAVDELREVVEFLKTPDKFRVLGGRIPKGVLLVGPPGTGKTLLARAIAGEAGVPFYSLSGSDFVEMFVGVGAARVRDMFQQAQTRSPCIVFIDELDALGKTRGSSVVGGHDEREQTLNALLVEMDGFSSNSGVIVMAATNRPETLDPALLRPGRFDRHVLVDRPDIRGREAILKVHVADVKIDESVDLRKVAALTSGFVGADLANLVNEAALLAARKEKSAVTIDEFNEGVERVTAGLEKRQRIIHVDEKERVAYHESAHALVAHSLPNTDPVHKVSIIPRGLAALGYTMQRPEGDRYLMTQSELESRIQVLLAGTVGEEMVFEDVSTGAQNDLQRATEIARSMVMDFGMSRLGRVNYREDAHASMLGDAADFARARMHSEQTTREIDEEIKRIIDQAIEKVRHILQTRRAALVALAKRLIEKEVIDTAELDEIVEANSPGPVLAPGTTQPPRRALSDPLAPEADSEAAGA
ncbi:MAG: ATP-dependent zinc metalloprotease FtsH [Pirellulales bacterium]|nr:ATP-dependent zinc metalloprotease FtsH [Pirellulales bacterium]